MEDFVLALENYVRSINDMAMFVLQKESEPCSIGAFKKLRYTLWYIDKLREKRFPIYTIQSTIRITSPEEETAYKRELDIKFMSDVFKIVRGEKFNFILGGSYDECKPILDSNN